MKIIINTDDKCKVESVNFDGAFSFDDIINICFNILDWATNDVLKDAPEMSDYLYEHFNGIFELFFRNVFPEPPDGYFELSDAALLYAQDKIVAEAEKKGITFEEALGKFESRAREYVRQKKEGLS